MLNKITLSAFLLIVGSTASAQTTPTFGVKAGLNFASTTNTTSAITSFSAGAFANMDMGKSVWFQPGIYYSGKGYELHQADMYNAGIGFGLVASDISAARVKNEEKTTINYLQIPLNFVYHKSVKLGSFFIGAGPFASIALSGRYKGYAEYSMLPNQNDIIYRYDFDRKIKIGEEPEQMEDYTQFSDIKRMDFGATALAGFAFNNGLLFNVNYDLGLTNIRSGNYGTVKTRIIGFSLGFNF
ncbi:porin family protein [Mucilaginibacter galii]|nr:porin family protein [Mucilaginibacter galii]